MKKNLLFVLGICAMLCMTACGNHADSGQTSESLPVSESTENVKETVTAEETAQESSEVIKIETLEDYLEVYGQSTIEGEYITVGEVEGLTFVPCKSESGSIYISIYNNGEQCGWIGTEKFDSADWMEEAETKLTIRYSSHTGGAKVMEETETEYGKRYIVVDNSNLPFTKADTEWLVNTGVFKSLKEATAQYDSRYRVVYGAAGSEYAYDISIDKNFMSDELFDSLVKQVSFQADSFTKEAQESYCKAVTDIDYKEDDLYTRLFKSSNSGNMQVRFKVENMNYRIPDNMLAIQTGKGVWNLFKYSMTNGAKEIGTVEYLTIASEAAELEDTLQEFVPDAQFQDTEAIKGGQVFIFSQMGEENLEHVFVVPNKGETVLYLQYKIF